MQETLSAILLAGGRSSRMGRDKAELELGGVSLVRYQLDRLRSLGIGDIVVSGYAGSVDGARAVPDVYARRGPLGGIHAGLLAVRGSAALVLAVDTPLVPEAHLRALIAAHRGGVTITVSQAGLEPLIAVYDKDLAAVCEELLLTGKGSVRELFRMTTLTGCPYTGDERLLINGNTPEDYEEILRLLERDPTKKGEA